MRELNEIELGEVDGGKISTGTALSVAGCWVTTVAGVGLAVVGAPVLAGAAGTLALGLAITAAVSYATE